MKPPWIFSTRSCAHHVGARFARLALLLSLGEHGHPHCLADAVGQHDGPAHHLVGVLRIDAEPKGHVHALVEFRGRGLGHDVHGLFDRIAPGTIDERFRRLESLGHDRHVVTPWFLIIAG